MSDNFSNLRRDVLNYAQHPNNIDQTACRLCKQVFRNTQALIAHIESHMAHEEVAIRSLYSPNYINSQRQLVSPLFPTTFPMTMQLQETINFASNSSSFHAPPQSMAMTPLRRDSSFSGSHVGPLIPIKKMKHSPSFLSCAGNNVAEIAHLSIPQSRKRKLAEVSPHDGTRAFIMQLEKPIKKIDFIDLVNMDDDNSDVQPLNLALKL